MLASDKRKRRAPMARTTDWHDALNWLCKGVHIGISEHLPSACFAVDGNLERHCSHFALRCLACRCHTAQHPHCHPTRSACGATHDGGWDHGQLAEMASRCR